ncbi:GNAT family N-acetyltransferase [Pseudolysinimonas kribbensis]|uniref:GNAT family N-acetyltransferase n=1 Tax=Pseudolysinimonas kribbensis TaxID=433641 RepID=UPI0024E15EAD|nr:GNAT family N-acetyltransferase [Pseudolysinimonas kribbensis]
MDTDRAPGDGLLVRTERLLLRRWRVGDAPVEHELWGERDPRVPAHRRITSDGHPTQEELEERTRRDQPPPSLGILAVERRGLQGAIGYCGLIANAYGQDDEPELAYELLRRAWGHGYATEAARGVIGWAQASGHRRLWATVREWNTASRRVLAKLGFVESGRVEPDELHGDSIFTTRAIAPPD